MEKRDQREKMERYAEVNTKTKKRSCLTCPKDVINGSSKLAAKK